VFKRSGMMHGMVVSHSEHGLMIYFNNKDELNNLTVDTIQTFTQWGCTTSRNAGHSHTYNL